MNGMVQSYNSAMQNNLEAVNKLVEAEARAKEVEQASDVVISQAIEGKLAREEAEKEALVNKENAIKMVERDLKMDSEVVRCRRLLAEARGLRNMKVARAMQTARRELRRPSPPSSGWPRRRCCSSRMLTTSLCICPKRGLIHN